ncbi:MAG: radical SAM protein [Gammaproteobacteria bacterium]|nr:radical SAM protein [Gammaproteobacteria bacterium]
MVKKVDELDSEVPAELATKSHGGHSIRTGRGVVDRSKIGVIPIALEASGQKQPNQYNGHTYKNPPQKYRLDGHKMIYHMDRIVAWKNGERIAPIHIDMGITKFCNVGCTYCLGVTQGMTKGTMIEPEALLRFVKDAGRAGVRSIGFIGDGEPTLNPGLYDAVNIAAEVGVDTGMATNGLLLDMDHAHDMLKNMSYIRFNLSSAEAENFRKVHQSHPKNFAPLIEKMKALVRIKKENNYPCTIGIQMVLIPENFSQIVKMAELGAEIGVDYVQLKQCSDTEYKEIAVDYEKYIDIEEELKFAESFSADDYHVIAKWNKIKITQETDVYKNGFRKYDICYGTPFLGQISGNGKVYPCGPFFGKDRFLMGDIHEMSYYDIVQSDRYWQVQQDIIDNIDVHHDCTIGCRQDYLNKFLWDLENPPEHVNFV